MKIRLLNMLNKLLFHTQIVRKIKNIQSRDIYILIHIELTIKFFTIEKTRNFNSYTLITISF